MGRQGESESDEEPGVNPEIPLLPVQRDSVIFIIMTSITGTIAIMTKNPINKETKEIPLKLP